MTTMTQQLEESTQFLKDQGIESDVFGIILGTGLGDLVEHLVIEKEIAFDAMPHVPEATVEYHSGKLIYGTLNSKKVLVFQGRFHLYEGYNLWEVTYSLRTMHSLGINTL